MEFSDSVYLDWAIQSLRPEAEFTFNDADYSTVNWIKLDGKAPTKSEVDAEIKKIKAQMAIQDAEREVKRQAILDRLGITKEEAQLLLS